MGKTKIISLIFTFNEERNIADCIKSARRVSDEIVVIDMESRDKTWGVAMQNGAKVFTYPHTSYVEPAREFGIKKIKDGWVLILDADERVTDESAEELKSAVSNPEFSNYKIPRKNIFGNKVWLRHGGWWPDYQTRLINTTKFLSWPKHIHSTPKIDGQNGILSEPLLHYFHGNIENMVSKTVIFENIESDLLLKAGKSAKTTTFFRKFIGELWRRLFKRFGFLDGEVGIIENVYQAFSKTITYLYLYEKKSRSL